MRLQDSFSKRDLSANSNDGLTQNINIDLRTTRRHQTFCENFLFPKNIFTKKFAKCFVCKVLKNQMKIFFFTNVEKLV